MQQALILVDIQNDYFSNGHMALVGMEQAASNAATVLRKFREQRLPLFHIQHVSTQPGAHYFVPGPPGVEIHAAVAPLAGEPIAQKHFPNAFRETPLLGWLKDAKVEEVVICGAMTHMCIDATTRAAFDFGFHCQVVEDACATRDLAHGGTPVAAADVQAAFMAALAVPYAQIVSTGQLLDER
jgi:nicotinamidase-related amidase